MTTRAKQQPPAAPRKEASGRARPRIRGVDARKNPVRALREDLGVSQATMARLLDVSLRTVSGTEAKVQGQELPRTFRELRRLADGLLSIIRKDGLGDWFERPNEGFAGLKPVEVIERGEVDRLWRMIHRVGGGEPL